MKKRRLEADVFFCLLLVAILACAYVLVTDTGHVTLNVIRFAVTLIFMLIAYFTSLITGLTLNVLGIFGYSTYLIVMVLTRDAVVDIAAYFFMVMCPIMTVCASLPFRQISVMENDNFELTRQLAQTAAFDEETNLRTLRALDSDLDIYRALADAGGKYVVLLIWQVRFPAELQRIMGARAYRQAIVQLSRQAKLLFPKGETVYIISTEPHRWASLQITDSPQNSYAVLDEARKRLDHPVLNIDGMTRVPDMELRFAALEDTGEMSCDSLVQSVMERMAYDV